MGCVVALLRESAEQKQAAEFPAYSYAAYMPIVIAD